MISISNIFIIYIIAQTINHNIPIYDYRGMYIRNNIENFINIMTILLLSYILLN